MEPPPRVTLRAAVLAIAMACTAAVAQAYPQLHVIALAQRSDRATVEPGGVFHVTIHARVAQARDRLDELILGAFSNCEIISNETVRSATPAGTDFVERLTVQALAPGDATISPAYIDALDPALGKPMRFSSNAIVVHVTGGDRIGSVLDSVADKGRRLLLALAIVACLFAAAFVVFTLFVRRRRLPQPSPAPARSVPPPPAPDPVPAATDAERVARAAQRYRDERSPAALAELRAALFTLAGVPAGATLVDALTALGDRDAALRTALVACEAATFGPAAERPAAAEAMLAAIAASARTLSPNEAAWTR